MPYLIFRRTVHCVARKGCAHGREMHPYLMRSAGFESETQRLYSSLEYRLSQCVTALSLPGISPHARRVFIGSGR